MNRQLRLEQDVTEIRRQVNEGVGGDGETTDLGARSAIDFAPLPVFSRTPAANQLWNGDFSHSVNTWAEAIALPASDQGKECWNWYSNDPMSVGQALDFTNALTSALNQTLKEATHSTYNIAFADWNRSKGYARLNGLKTLDAPLPQNTAVAGRLFCIGAIIARAHSRIVIPTDCHLGAGIFDNTAGQRDWLKSSVAFSISTFQVRGVPGATTERRYKVFARTDRGYTYLSAEVTLATAPADGSFSSTVDVYLIWERIEGVLEYWVYRHNVVAGTFDLLDRIGSGANSYADNGALDTANVGGYPTATDDRRRAVVATLTGALTALAIDGVDPIWDSLFLNIEVPGGENGYQQSNTTDRQVLRLYLDQALDREMTDAISLAGNNQITSATGAFSAEDTGLQATLLDNTTGATLHGPEAITFVDATHITFASNVATSNNPCTLYIIAGGHHGLLIDLVHGSYLTQAAYAPHPDDFSEARRLQPAATPNGSTQGTVGGPSGGEPPAGGDDPGRGGLGGCVVLDTPVATYCGNREVSIPYALLRLGEMLVSGNLRPNSVRRKPPPQMKDIWYVRSENELEIWCSAGQGFITSADDHRGTAVCSLRPGDFVITSRDGRRERSRLIECTATGKRAPVGSLTLAPGHIFIAGRLRRWRWVRWLRRKLRMRDGISGFYLHNVKALFDTF